METCEHNCANCAFAKLEPSDDIDEMVGVCTEEARLIHGDDWCIHWTEAEEE